MDDNYKVVTSESVVYASEATSDFNVKDKAFLNDTLDGLNAFPKLLPCKYFYDEAGSALFEKICELDEYYITRTEIELLENIKKELAEKIGKNAIIIEPGAGAGKKIQTLLRSLDSPQTYVPMDISKDFLFYSANIIQEKFPSIEVSPIQGDFTQPIEWLENKNRNRVVFFPGSTIGNFEPNLAIDFLTNMRELMGYNGAMIIGVDRLKSRQTLINAYDDSAGITAKFNKNLLVRINQELNGNFNLDQFAHQAIFNEQYSRIEMHLISKIDQTVFINNNKMEFKKGESIHTENSHKYSEKSFLELVSNAGLTSIANWSDKDELFSIYFLRPRHSIQ